MAGPAPFTHHRWATPGTAAGLAPKAATLGDLRDMSWNLHRVQQNVSDAFQQFTGNQMLGGVLKPVTFRAPDSDVLVTHGLGSLQVSYFVAGLSAPAMVFTSPKGSGDKNTVLVRCRQAGVAPWIASTPYSQGAEVSYTVTGTVQLFVAQTSGTSGATAPPWSIPGTTSDNGIVWANTGALNPVSKTNPLLGYLYLFTIAAQPGA